jgi:hypothetical protein
MNEIGDCVHLLEVSVLPKRNDYHLYLTTCFVYPTAVGTRLPHCRTVTYALTSFVSRRQM